jgi:hypothetical protein
VKASKQSIDDVCLVLGVDPNGPDRAQIEMVYNEILEAVRLGRIAVNEYGLLNFADVMKMFPPQKPN